jgi:class 3 adenylate cyclase
MPTSEGAAMTEPAGHGVRRMCLAFDLERYSAGSDAEQIEKQRAMMGMVREACDRGALERAHWLKQEQGDGELAVLPPGIDETHVITALWREFREGLHRYNRHANAGARLRMRVAVHEGIVYIGENGFAGTAINTVCRLRDCHEAKDALSGTDGDLVLIASDRIYQDVIRGHDGSELPASAFAETAIDIPDKGFQTTAYVFSGVPARPGTPPSAPAPGAPVSDSTAADAQSGSAGTADGSIIISGANPTMRDVVKGIVHHHYEDQR